jgi:hypothetical protein
VDPDGITDHCVVILMAYIIWPGVGLEYLSIIYAVPVFMVNGWEWLDPEFMAKVVEIFGKGKGNS